MAITRFKTLLAIAKLGTFADAAEAVHRTPAAVSQQMKSLEEELGVKLFDRSKRPPELSPIGHALVPKAQGLVKAYEALRTTLTGEMDLVEHLTVGPVPTAMPGLMIQTLKKMQSVNRSLHVRVYPGLSEDLYTQVDRGFLDAAIITEPKRVHSHLDWKPFAEEPLVVVACPDAKEDDPRQLLETHPFIRFSRRAWVGRMIDTWLLENDIYVREVMETESLESVTAMVFHDLGVSIIPVPCCSSAAELPLKSLPLPSPKSRILGVLSRHDSSKVEHVELLWKSIVTIVTSAGRVRVLD